MGAWPWIDRILRTGSGRHIAGGKRVLHKVNQMGKVLADETDHQLQQRSQTLRERAVGNTGLNDLLVETFALVREVAKRQLGLFHFDVQVLGGIGLHQGQIVEMKTGEGKTLVATLPVVLHALSGQGVHVVTVNDYLAQRDADWMGPVYRFLGLRVGVVLEDMDFEDGNQARKQAYQADITYVTNHELVFDYLRDNLAESRAEQVQRPLRFGLVDEVDLLLLDEAQTPLIISGSVQENTDFAYRAVDVVSALKAGADFRVDYKTRRVAIDDQGWNKMEKALGLENLAAPEHLAWQHALHNALLAHGVYQRDVDYIVREDEVLLVDDYTGRVSPDKRFSDGLHQALEAKEGLSVQAEDQTLAKVSYQMFFRLYPLLCGMTGTAYSAREEFQRTYGRRVVVIPTHQPTIRVDESATVFVTADEKFQAVVQETSELIRVGRPVLIGTTSVRESEQVSRLLSQARIEHTVLNAKDDSTEADIIAQAGRPSAVTVSTNLAGRGVDILLGGNPQENEVTNPAEPSDRCEQDRARVVAAGGLMVLGTGLHESRRIDDQLRGRAGRQGDPGGSHYFLSLDDAIYRKFGEGDKGFQTLQDLRQRLQAHPKAKPIHDLRVLRALTELQRKVEIENESIRRDVLRYDLVVDLQRHTIYNWRQTLLGQQPVEMLGLLKDMASDLVGDFSRPGLLAQFDPEEDSHDEPESDVLGEAFFDLCERLGISIPDGPDALEQIASQATTLVADRLSALEKQIGSAPLARLAGQLMLETIDEMWTEHLNDLERVDDAVGLSGYAQLDPLIEFRKEAHLLFQTMLAKIRLALMTRLLSHF